MDPNDITGQLPQQLREGPRAYLLAGGLGLLLFVSSWRAWGDGSFLGSMLLELGGGAFIVFLLEFLLPRALRYADDATWHVALAKIDITWSDRAVESLLTDFSDVEVEGVVRRCRRRAAFPSEAKASAGVFDTGTVVGGRSVLSQQVGADLLLCYCAEQSGPMRRKSVVILAILRATGVPGSDLDEGASHSEPAPG